MFSFVKSIVKNLSVITNWVHLERMRFIFVRNDLLWIIIVVPQNNNFN